MVRWSLLVLFLIQVPNRALAVYPIDHVEAMRLAEAFVRTNGYTDAPPTKEFRDPESFERGSDKVPLTRPEGLLASQAWGFRRGARSDERGWSVMFQIKKKPPYKLKPNEVAYGKIIQMDRYGRGLIVIHGIVVACDKPEFAGYMKRPDLLHR